MHGLSGRLPVGLQVHVRKREVSSLAEFSAIFSLKRSLLQRRHVKLGVSKGGVCRQRRAWVTTNFSGIMPSGVIFFFFCLQGFLTAVLQNHARLTQTPIDQLSFGFDVLAMDDAVQLATPPDIGVCVSGLHLEGARYVAAHVLCSTNSASTVLCSTDLALPVWSGLLACLVAAHGHHSCSTLYTVYGVYQRFTRQCCRLMRIVPAAYSRLGSSTMLCCLACQLNLLCQPLACCCRWSAELGAIVSPEAGSMTNPLPLVHFKPQQGVEHSRSTSYSCPLYQTSARSGTLSSTGQSTNFVLHIDLHIPTNTVPADWVLQGVAAICSVNE